MNTAAAVYTSFFGNKNIALAVGVVMCIILLGKYFGPKTVSKVMAESLSQAGPAAEAGTAVRTGQ